MSTQAAAKAGGTGEQSIASRVQTEIERAIQRNIKGLEFLRTPPPPMGGTPRDLIHKKGTLNLFHYRPMADEVYRVPVLFVMAPMNTGAIFDVAPGQSLIEFLLKQGYDVFLIDWTEPRPEEKSVTLEDFAINFISECVRSVGRETGEPDVTLVGYCGGGILSCIYAATHPDGPVKNIVCFTTPIDFEQMGLFKTWTDPRYFDVDRLVDTMGIIPGEVISTSMSMLRPASRPAGMIGVWENMWNDEYVKQYRRFDHWANNMVSLPGEYLRQMVKDLMWGNKLYKGELKLGGREVNLENIEVPLLHIIAEHDHVAPLDATKVLVEMVGSKDKEALVMKGGHVSVFAGSGAVKRMWPKLDSWLAPRSI